MGKKKRYAQGASKLRLLDLFSGVGGFHKGFEQAQYNFDWVGFSEVDKYSAAVYKYQFPEAVELGDVRTIRHIDLPKIDIITFGSPCQDFSLSGKRTGLKGDRSSLISEPIRLISECRPSIFVWENVKGTFSSNNGEDFWAIIKAFTNIGGYRLDWQLLNTSWFQGTPQNRERIYLVGYTPTSRRSTQSVFPIGEGSSETTEVHRISSNHTRTITTAHSHGSAKHMSYVRTPIKKIGKVTNGEAGRVFATDGVSPSLRANGGGMGAKTGLYEIKEGTYNYGSNLYKVGELKITAKKRSHDTPPEINEYLKANKNGKTIGEIAKSTKLPKTQVEHYFRSDKYRAIPNPKDWMTLKTILQFDNTYDKQVNLLGVCTRQMASVKH